MKRNISVPESGFIFIASCQLPYQPQSVHYADCCINKSDETDISVAAFLKPYSYRVHAYTFMDKTMIHKNKPGCDGIVNQTGWAGIISGRPDLIFVKNKSKNLVNTCTVVSAGKSSE